jgi:predicted nuclease of predicted toxin-antitoxin system
MIVADENIFRGLIAALRKEGFDVISIFESYRGMSDVDIAAFSLNPPRIIITEDKDFGKLIFENNVMVVGIIFLRFLDTERDGIIEKVISLLQNENLESLKGKYITITPNKIRVNYI